LGGYLTWISELIEATSFGKVVNKFFLLIFDLGWLNNDFGRNEALLDT